MVFSFSLNICEDYGDFLEHLSSNIQHRLLHVDIEIRYVSSLAPETTLETFDQSVFGRRDVFLSKANARNIIRSSVEDSGASQEFVDIVLVPDILSYARYADSLSHNLGRQVIGLRVELLVELDLENEIDELVDESLANSVNFKPASKSSIEYLKSVKYLDDEDEEYLPLKKRRKLSEDSSSRKRCTVCLDEFSDGDEVTSTPCDHVYHYSCIVEWLAISHVCPLCRY